MMKTTIKYILATLLGLNLGYAEELPDAAKDVIAKLKQWEKRAEKNLERDVIEKKKEVLKALERSARKEENRGVLRFYNKSISELKSEIAKSEAIIEGTAVVNFIQYEAVYHYKHPVAEIFKQRGELSFLKNGKVRLQHFNDKDKIVYDESWDWELKDGRVVILDEKHGNIEIRPSPRNENQIMMKWISFDKTNRAKIRNK